MPIKSPLINVMQTSIMKVSRRLLRDFGEIENIQLSHEKIDKFVSNSLSYVIHNLKDNLQHSRTDWGIAHENESLEKDKFYWLLEPINGLENFKRGIPIFAIAIAVVKNDEILASAIFDPTRDQFFFAEKGKGAFVNDRRIRVSNRVELKSGLISIEEQFEVPIIEKIKSLNINPFQNIRSFYCSALSFCWLSSGKIDCFIGNNVSYPVLKSGELLLTEAGGFISQKSNNKSTLIISANPKIHKIISKFYRQNQS